MGEEKRGQEAPGFSVRRAERLGLREVLAKARLCQSISVV